MKRTKSINLNRMRKCFPKTPLALAVAASTLALSGCGEEKMEAEIFKTLDDCIAKGNEQAACEIAYKNAKAEAEKSAPKYRTLAECQAEFGPTMCQGGNNSSSGDFFMPFMAGYMMSSMLDGGNDRRYTTTPIFTSTNSSSRYYNTYSTAGGSQIGRVGATKATVGKSVYAPKPKATVATTKSRGGFGSKAAVKSGGSSKSGSSSSRGGWGG